MVGRCWSCSARRGTRCCALGSRCSTPLRHCAADAESRRQGSGRAARRLTWRGSSGRADLGVSSPIVDAATRAHAGRPSARLAGPPGHRQRSRHDQVHRDGHDGRAQAVHAAVHRAGPQATRWGRQGWLQALFTHKWRDNAAIRDDPFDFVQSHQGRRLDAWNKEPASARSGSTKRPASGRSMSARGPRPPRNRGAGRRAQGRPGHPPCRRSEPVRPQKLLPGARAGDHPSHRYTAARIRARRPAAARPCPTRGTWRPARRRAGAPAAMVSNAGGGPSSTRATRPALTRAQSR